jgi:hypothetical protein
MKKWINWMLVLALATAVFPGVVRAEEAEEVEGEIGWFGAMRAKMLARQFEIDTTAALKLTAILREEGMEKKRLNGEIKELLAELDLAVRGQSGVRPIATLFDEVRARKAALGVVENTTLDRVVELMGQEKAARWLLSRRGMMERVTGNVRRAGQRDQSEVSAEESPRPARPRRSGSY